MTTFEQTIIENFLRENHNTQIKNYFSMSVLSSAPRMTKSDTWRNNPNHPNPKQRQRKCVTKYFAYRDELQKNLKRIGYTQLPEILKVIFLIEMPESWSKKKKEEMSGKFHKQKPDFDNLEKAFMDSFRKDDSSVAGGNVYKFWAYKSGIVIF